MMGIHIGYDVNTLLVCHRSMYLSYLRSHHLTLQDISRKILALLPMETNSLCILFPEKSLSAYSSQFVAILRSSERFLMLVLELMGLKLEKFPTSSRSKCFPLTKAWPPGKDFWVASNRLIYALALSTRSARVTAVFSVFF